MTRPVTDLDSARAQLVLALADDELMIGQRSLEWTGFAPSLEEDLAFSTIAQEEINHADVWYQVLLELPLFEQRSRPRVDRLALGRAPDAYRHARLCERTSEDYAYVLARHWAYDHADQVRLAVLTESNDDMIASVATRMLHEERYHVEHADEMVARVAGARPEARSRLVSALRRVLPDAWGLFESPQAEAEAVENGILPVSMTEIGRCWKSDFEARLLEHGLDDVVEMLAPGQDAFGGRRGHHTRAFTEGLWPDLTGVHQQEIGTRW